jgi:NTE family protein
MKIGFALSGGGARGIAHLGVLKALDELGIKPAIFSGVSSGAIASVFYAAGYKPDEIFKLIKELSLYRIVRPALGFGGLLHLDEVEKLYRTHLGENATFEDLNIPVIICATEINEGVSIYFSTGELISPLIASSAVPILYKPVAYQKKLLCDGGLLNNLPIEPLIQNCDLKVGVHVNPINHNARVTTLRSMIERTAHLAINNNVKMRVHLCDFLIEPPELRYFRLMSFSKADDIFEIGYKHTMQIAPYLLKLTDA